MLLDFVIPVRRRGRCAASLLSDVKAYPIGGRVASNPGAIDSQVSGPHVGGMATPETTTSSGGGWPLAGLLLVILLGVVILLNPPWGGDVPQSDSAAGPGGQQRPREATGPTITLRMKVPGREVRPLQFRVDQGATLLEAMREASERDPAWGFRTQGTESDPLVVELAGRANGEPAGHYWTYDLNGEPGQVGIGACQLVEGDDILWKFAPNE